MNGAVSADQAKDTYSFPDSYEAVGNRKVQTRTITNTQVVNYVYDNANRLTSANGVPFNWDNNGNLLSDGTSVYSYTQANYLKALAQGATTYNYTYNGDGTRVKQQAGTTPTTYTLDLAARLVHVLAQQQAGTTTQYIYGTGQIGERASGSVAYHLTDALGSVRQLADSTGGLTLMQGYEPYGYVVNTAGTGTTLHGFTGEQRDATGLEYLRARYYKPYTMHLN